MQDEMKVFAFCLSMTKNAESEACWESHHMSSKSNERCGLMSTSLVQIALCSQD